MGRASCVLSRRVDCGELKPQTQSAPGSLGESSFQGKSILVCTTSGLHRCRRDMLSVRPQLMQRPICLQPAGTLNSTA